MLETVVTRLPIIFREEPIACGLILGSGWGELQYSGTVLAKVPYTDLEGFGASTVAGHSGELLLLQWKDKRIVIFSGRRHYYEGCSLEQITYPVELLRCLGVKCLLLTNAAGGLNPAYHPGDLMVLTDHLNLTGVTPLRGAHRPEWGERFPDMTHVYDVELSERLYRSIPERAQKGVYAFSTGPAYETPAEVRALQILGGDAVGMSTVPEATLAHACGMRVVALSCITNLASGLNASPLTHEEVLAESTAAKPRMIEAVNRFLAQL